MTRTMPSTPQILVVLILALIEIACVDAHGIMVKPEQRGALSNKNRFHRGTDPNAPNDDRAHFPAGDKSSVPGSAVASQERESQPEGWTPFEPLKPGFKWRAGVCGDEKGKPQEHLKGGKFYYGGKIVETYEQGQDIEITMNIIAHHNGFVEMHICDVEKCGGEISEACFRQGHCQQLRRSPNGDCDSGTDKQCAPIDPDYPGRWYLPCGNLAVSTEIMGGKKMQFKLPANLACSHCVLHWFWTAANICNPPGVIEFFEGPNRPTTWGDCPGQAGARGGYTKVQAPCSANRVPEEYYQCADVAIVRNGRAGPSPKPSEEPSMTPEPATKTPKVTPEPDSDSSGSSDPTVTPIPSPAESVTPTPAPEMETQTSDSNMNLKKLVLFADGKEVESLPDGAVVDISDYNKIAIEAVTNDNAKGQVDFYIDDYLVWTDYYRPYFMYGNRGSTPNYWNEPIVNEYFNVRVEADGEKLTAKIKFVKDD